jgi:hypothetical protein
MKIKIDEKLICIPPYISTTWDQISFLQSEEESGTGYLILALHLKDGKTVRIPQVDSSLIDIAFAAHVKFLESKISEQNQAEPNKAIGNLLQQLTGLTPDQFNNLPIRFGISGVEGMPGMEALQHNSTYGNAPDMPAEVLDKISGMIKMLSNGEVSSFPKPELHCNCPHCQVARSVHNIEKEPVSPIDQPVSDEELSFRDWEIVKKGDKLYNVINLESKEEYSVYLGTPIGCTCGNTSCEHIKAVLYTYL